MNERPHLTIRIGALRVADRRTAHEIEAALDAALRGHERAGTGPAAAAVVARILTELDKHPGDHP